MEEAVFFLVELKNLLFCQVQTICLMLSFHSFLRLFIPCACRPHPNECSGSDLDGDIYFVSWDQSLIPTRMVPPMDYTPAPTEKLGHNVTIEVF